MVCCDVCVSDLSGTLCNVQVPRLLTASSVKAAVETTVGIPAVEQRIFIGGVELFGSHILQYVAERAITVNLIRRAPADADWMRQLEFCWLKLHAAPETVRADPEAVLTAVRENAWALRYASSNVCSIRPVVLAAVQQDGRVLECASEELRADKELVLTAVRVHGEALEFAAQELRADVEVVLAAVAQNQSAIRHADEELRDAMLSALWQVGSTSEPELLVHTIASALRVSA